MGLELEDDIRVTPGFGFYLRPSYCSLGTCKARRVALLGIKRTRAGETRQGRRGGLTRLLLGSWRGIYNCNFFEVFMVPRLLAPARTMRSCTCADVIQPCLSCGEGQSRP